MSKLNDLIAELCPDGVEWKKLGEVIRISKVYSLTSPTCKAKAVFPSLTAE